MKKQASFDLSGESRDLLLFDYLEGKLTEEMASRLEDDLMTDPALSAELENWKDSYVVQDFYSTDLLEERLLTIPQRSFSLSGPLVGFSLVLITLFFSFLPVGERSEKKLMSTSGAAATINVMERAQEDEKSVVETIEARSEAALPLITPVKSAEVMVTSEKFTPAYGGLVYKLPAIQALMPDADHVSFDAEKVQINIPKLVRQQQVGKPKQISRKQQRQIRRMKAKALQQRQAKEFIKGNRPYVVPLDTKNF